MRASTAEGWYVLSSIAVSFRRSRGKKRATLRPVNGRGTTAAPTQSKVRVTPPPAVQNVPTRSIVLLAGAGFASQAMVRVTDSLLPQIAHDFNSSVGEAAIVISAYSLAHGSVQLIIGPIADRFGKYKTVALMCALACVLVALCGLAASLSQLAVARFASGAAAGWIIPTSMAYVGDVTPYERRQPILARYLSGQIVGQLFGQAAGGVLGDLLGWRNVFFVLAAMFALATAGLIVELVANPRTRAAGRRDGAARGFAAEYAAVLSSAWARFVILAAFIEASTAWGAFAYVGADLHLRFGLSFTAIGLIVGSFGIGGLLYAASVQQLVNLLGQPGLALFGGVLLGLAYLALAIGAAWWLAPLAVTAIGLGFYALHNTLQTNATQMTPQARGTAVAIFSSAIYLGQTVGVAAGALVFDRFTAVPLFLASALALPALAWWFARELRRRSP
jgi:MFS transporter, YNFM family, putative membrane transport protein